MKAVLHAGTRHFLVVSPCADGMFKVIMYVGRHKAWEVLVEESRLSTQAGIFQAYHPLNIPVIPHVPKEFK